MSSWPRAVHFEKEELSLRVTSFFLNCWLARESIVQVRLSTRWLGVCSSTRSLWGPWEIQRPFCWKRSSGIFCSWLSYPQTGTSWGGMRRQLNSTQGKYIYKYSSAAYYWDEFLRRKIINLYVWGELLPPPHRHHVHNDYTCICSCVL